jgi:hypothetical protein
MCDLHMHMYRYDRAKVVLTLFRSIRYQSYAVESQIQTANRLNGSATPVVASSFELNQRVLLFTSASGLDSLFIRQLVRPQSVI